ncbi:MAG: glycosyltransferase [Chloroflexi bacterium]|nr:glycosyltransferase [Chloroflexota bacterium]
MDRGELLSADSGARPHATVVIPAFNAGRTLAACLSSLAQQARDHDEIVVVDDGSTDDTSKLALEFSTVRLIRTERRGAAAARNRGARNASGELLLFTDADCEPAADWLDKMCAAFADPAVAGAKGAYRTRQRQVVARFVQLEYEEKYARMRRAPSIDFVDTYSAAYRREVFARVGGFDESFPGASVEDQELSFRLSELGFKLVFVPDALVYHQHVVGLGAYARRKFRIGYWKVRVHRLHPGKMLRDTHTPATLKIEMGLVLCMMPVLALAAASPGMWLVFGLLVIAFAVAATPLGVFIARRDRAVAVAAPLLILLRAVGLGAGWIAGSSLWFRK